jgi:hypothetical protein
VFTAFRSQKTAELGRIACSTFGSSNVFDTCRSGVMLEMIRRR